MLDDDKALSVWEGLILEVVFLFALTSFPLLGVGDKKRLAELLHPEQADEFLSLQGSEPLHELNELWQDLRCV